MATITGLLQKRGKINKAWKTRFFALNGTALVYYTELGGSKKGTINVAGAVVDLRDEEAGAEFAFSVTLHSGSVVVLAADTAEARREWVRYIAGVADDGIEVEGELQKFHKWRNKWAPRYFILDSAHLRWYKKRGGKFLGEVNAHELFGTLVPHETEHYTFTFAAAGKQMLLKAKTANEARDWLRGIKRVRAAAVGLSQAFREEEEGRAKQRQADKKAAAQAKKAGAASPGAGSGSGSGSGSGDNGDGTADDADAAAGTSGRGKKSGKKHKKAKPKRSRGRSSSSSSAVSSDSGGAAGQDWGNLEVMDLADFANLELGSGDSDSASDAGGDGWQDLRGNGGNGGTKGGHSSRKKKSKKKAAKKKRASRRGGGVEERKGHNSSSSSGVSSDSDAGSGQESAYASDSSNWSAEIGDGMHPNGLRALHWPAQAVRELQLTMVLVKRRDDLPDLPKLNHWQDRMCAYCLKEQTSGYFGKGEWSYYCHYTELMFCKSCFGNRKHRIPWRVIHRMDDKAYPVADVVCPYLEVMCKAGVVDLIKYNRDRWGNDESWLDLVEIRKHLAAAKLKAHPTQGVAKLEEVLPGADYMWRNTKMVSVNDIACLLDGTLIEPLENILSNFEEFARTHPVPVERPPTPPEETKRGLLSIFSRKKKSQAVVATPTGVKPSHVAGERAYKRMNVLDAALPHSGFMLKRGARRTAWQKRWIQLECSEMTYSKERFGRTKGTLILSGDSSVKRMDDAHMLKLEPKRRARKRVLRVRFTKAGRDVYLQAPSNETLLDWIDSFNEHIDAARAQDGLEAPADSDGEEAKRAKARAKAEAAAKAAKEEEDAASSAEEAAPKPEPVTGRGSTIRQAAKSANARRHTTTDASGKKTSTAPHHRRARTSLATGKGRHGADGWDDETEAARRQSLNALLSRN